MNPKHPVYLKMKDVSEQLILHDIPILKNYAVGHILG